MSAWPDDILLQKIAKQNLFAETAFIVQKEKQNPELRWFTVSQEVDFCGYGTISAAFVFLNYVHKDANQVTFNTKNYGSISVVKDCSTFKIKVGPKPPLTNVFDKKVFEALSGEKPEMKTTARGDILIIYDKEEDVLSIKPDFKKLMACGYYGYILTSSGSKSDYVYRYFSPRMTNVWEDPVNCASQTVLIPYWSERLKKQKLHGKSASERGGELFCESHVKQDLVSIGGEVCLYQKGIIFI